MKGKEKCKALKEIRQKIAEENDIAYVVSECSHKGECKGTCPKCEAEVRYLERELARKEKLGKTIAVAGVALSVCTGLTACGPSSLNIWDSGMTAGALPAVIEDDVCVTSSTADVELEGEATEVFSVESAAIDILEPLMGEILPDEVEKTVGKSDEYRLEGDIALSIEPEIEENEIAVEEQ